MNFKLFAVFVAFALMAIASTTFAAQQDDQPAELNVKPQGVSVKRPPLVPQARITCDILGSDAYCAVHCIAKGYRGGYCNEMKVCVCR